jgi:hypothetical protein
VFATPVLGVGGRNEASAALSLTGPLGNTIGINRTQDLVAFGDIIPQVALKWNMGVNNLMVYGMGDIPIGAYDPSRLQVTDDFGAPASLDGFRSRASVRRSASSFRSTGCRDI